MRASTSAAHRLLACAAALLLIACSRLAPPGPVPTVRPTPTNPSAPPAGRSFGINISGGEYGPPKRALYATAGDLDYYMGRGLRVFRLNLSWELLQPSLGGPLGGEYVGWARSLADHCAAAGCRLILDVHNYARYRGEVIGSPAVPLAAFRDLWRRLAGEFRGHPGIYAYGLMNEPHDTGGLWTQFNGGAQAGIDGVREADPDTLILVPGDDWTGAETWAWSDLNRNFVFVDPSNRFLVDAHVYFDRDSSGSYGGSYEAEGAAEGVGVERTRPFAEWLRARGYRGFLGEYGVPDDDPRWLAALDRLLGYVRDTPELAGGTYWVGGPIAAFPNGKMELPVGGDAKPQWRVLARFPTTLLRP